MSAEFPFQALLDALNQAGFSVDARQRLDFFALCSRYDGSSRDEFAQATASLFAATPKEYKQIVDIFDRIYPREGGPLSANPAKQDKRINKAPRRKRLFFILGLFLCLIVLAAAAFTKKAPPENTADSPAPAGGRRDPSRSEAVQLPVPSEAFIKAPTNCDPVQNTRVFWRFPLIVTGVALVLACLIASAAAGRRKRQSQRETGITRALLSLNGPRNYRIDYPFMPLIPEQLDAMIALLEEALASIGHSKELDIDRTVDQTVQRGLVPSLHYRTRHGALKALVLIDIGDLSRPFRAKINIFIQRLKQRGLDIDFLYFDRHPAQVSKKPGSKLFPLETMAAKWGGIPMILIATGEALAEEGAASPLSHARLFQAWPHRILLNPIGDPKHWARGLDREHAGIAAFPMNKEGLLSARQALLEQRSRIRAPRSRRLLEEPLWGEKAFDPDLLKALFSMAPLPSYELAWALRERFFPSAPEQIVLSCRHFIECSVDQMDSESFQIEKERALAALKELDGSGLLQRQARQFFIELLHQYEPAQKNSAAYLRWRRDLAFLYLQSDQRDEIQKGIFELRQLAEGPLRKEITLQLERGMTQADRTGLFSKVLRSVQGARLDLPAGRGLALAWPGLKSIGFSFLLVGLLAAVFNAFGFYSARPFPWGGMVLGKTEFQTALCLSLGGIHDVLKKDGHLFMMGSYPGNENTAYEALHVRTWGPLYRMSETSVQFEPSELQGAAMFQWCAPEICVFRKDEDGFRFGSSVAVSLFDGLNMGEAPKMPDKTSALEIDVLRWHHSDGILPGSGEDVWKRLIDPDYPRAQNPAAEVASPTPTAQPTAQPESPPACETGKTRCKSECIDLQNDKNNCGECGKACGQAQICAEGICQRDPKSQEAPCPAGQSLCGSECTNLQSDILNCGQCDRRCGADKVCTRGLCQPCPSGTVKCGSGCVNTNTHRYHCGSCFKTCDKGGSCQAGVCVLPPTPAATPSSGDGKPTGGAPAKPPAPRPFNPGAAAPGGQLPMRDQPTN